MRCREIIGTATFDGEEPNAAQQAALDNSYLCEPCAAIPPEAESGTGTGE